MVCCHPSASVKPVSFGPCLVGHPQKAYSFTGHLHILLVILRVQEYTKIRSMPSLRIRKTSQSLKLDTLPLTLLPPPHRMAAHAHARGNTIPSRAWFKLDRWTPQDATLKCSPLDKPSPFFHFFLPPPYILCSVFWSQVHDPIHDQKFYLTEAHKKKLKAETGENRMESSRGRM